MNWKINEALCELRTPKLLEATEHSEPAQRIAQRILRHNAILGPQYFKEMTPQDRQRRKRVFKMTATLQVNESLGKW